MRDEVLWDSLRERDTWNVDVESEDACTGS